MKPHRFWISDFGFRIEEVRQYGNSVRARYCKAALVVLSAMAVAGGCGKKEAPPERPAALVTAADVNARDVPLYLDEIGTCTAVASVTVRPRVTGELASVHFVDGTDVKKGDLLFTIDDRPFKAALEQARASLAQNEATLELARQEYERAKRLLPSSAISQEEFQTRETAFRFAEGLVRNGKAAVDTAQLNLDYCYIHSPVDGRASLNLLDVGNIVTSAGAAAGGGTAMLSVQTMDPIYADFTITERDLVEVRAAMGQGPLKAMVRLPGEAEEAGREGELTFLDNAVQSPSGTVKMRVTLANTDRHFWPGQFVRVRLVLRTLKGAVLAPSSAVAISQNGPYVYVIKPDMTAELRQVKTGQRQGELVVVSEGLTAGEKVVTSGQIGVTPGGKVKMQEATKAAESGKGKT